MAVSYFLLQGGLAFDREADAGRRMASNCGRTLRVGHPPAIQFVVFLFDRPQYVVSEWPKDVYQEPLKCEASFA